MSAEKFSVTSDRGTYLIYSLNGPLTLSASEDRTFFFALTPFKGVLRMAKLHDTAHESALDTHVATYATAVATEYEFDDGGSSADLIFKWNTVGDPKNLMMLTWPHHRLVYSSIALLNADAQT